MTMKKAFRTALASMCVVWALANTRIAFWEDKNSARILLLGE